jgi:hypothetical protein
VLPLAHDSRVKAGVFLFVPLGGKTPREPSHTPSTIPINSIISERVWSVSQWSG